MKNAGTAWGGIFLPILKLNKEIFYSIRLVPGSSPGQPTMIIISKSYIYINQHSIFVTDFIHSKKDFLWIYLDKIIDIDLLILLLVDTEI